MVKYLDEAGLSYLWSKIKALFKLSNTYGKFTGDDSQLQSGDSYDTAFGKLEKTITDNEEVTAAALNDLNSRIPTKTSQLTNDSGYITDINGKADKVVPSNAGNIAVLNSSGNLSDSGITIDDLPNIDTKNTTGSTNNNSKLYLVGAPSQSANPQTYSQTNAYITSGKVYSNGKETVNLTDSQTLTNKTLTSPNLTGTPTATTAAAGTNSTQVATTAFVKTAVDNAVGNYILTSQKGVSGGVASLDSDGKVPSSQLPSYVDDVIEVYTVDGQTPLTTNWLSETKNGTPITPESGKIYVLLETVTQSGETLYSANSQFRWSGSAYTQLYDGGVTSISNDEIDTITNA